MNQGKVLEFYKERRRFKRFVLKNRYQAFIVLQKAAKSLKAMYPQDEQLIQSIVDEKNKSFY